MAGEAQAGDIHKESGEESGSNGALQELFEDPPPQRCEQCWVSPGSVDACHEHVTRCMYVCAVAQIFSSLVTLEAAINGNDFKPLPANETCPLGVVDGTYIPVPVFVAFLYVASALLTLCAWPVGITFHHLVVGPITCVFLFVPPLAFTEICFGRELIQASVAMGLQIIASSLLAVAKLSALVVDLMKVPDSDDDVSVARIAIEL